MTRKEEYAIILDFLPNGYPFESNKTQKKMQIAQAIGKNSFTLLELVPKKGVFLKPQQEVYIGEGKRDEIHHVIGLLPYEKLTVTAQTELSFVIEKLVSENEKKYVEFFNTAGPLTTRMHSLELLPGCGKKHMWEIIEQREQKPFESFEDIKKRVKLMPDPKKAIIKRIEEEIKGKEKHRLFTE